MGEIKTESNPATGEQTVKVENAAKTAEATTGTTGSRSASVRTEHQAVPPPPGKDVEDARA